MIFRDFCFEINVLKSDFIIRFAFLEKLFIYLEKKKMNQIFEGKNLVLDKKLILDFLVHQESFLQKEFHIKKIALFGSFAQENAKDDSDIDLLVEFEENTEDLFFLKEDLRKYFSEVFKRKIDLVNLKAMNPFFKKSILRDAIFI